MKFTKNIKKIDDTMSDASTQIRNASFKQMLRYADRNDYIILIIGVSLCVLNGAIAPLNSIFFRGMTDALMRGQAQYENGTLNIEWYSDAVLHNVRLYAVLGVAMFIIANISMGCLFTVCERQSHLIRKHYFAAVLRQDIAWFDHNQTGALTTKMSSGIDRIREGMGDKLGVLVQSTANFVFGIIVGLCYSWKITLVMMAIVPFIMITLYGSARALTMTSKREMYAHERAGSIATEVLECISTVTAFNAQYSEVARYSERLKEARNRGMFKTLITAIFTGVFLFVVFGSMGFVFWYGTTLVLTDEITPGTVFGVFWAVLGGAIRLGQAAPQIGVVIAARLAAGDIFAIIDREPEIDSMSADGLRPKHVDGRIELCNIHFRYPSREHVTVLKDINFKVEPGETVALVGHSGCGKSTIVGLILRYYDQQAGTLTIDGVPVRDLNIDWLRNTVGVVTQEPVLFAASIEENIRMGNEHVTEREMIQACTAANAHQFITKLPRGYKTVIGRGGIQLSGGQKQKIAIARALVRNPKILLLDEATSALDTESEVAVQRALDQAREGRTTLIVAHRLSTVRSADRIIVFSHGEIAEMGTHSQLMSLPDGVYRRLVHAQEIGEADDEFIDEDVQSVKLNRPRGGDGARTCGYQKQRSQEDELAECRKERLSERMRESLGSLKVYECETERDNENIRDELEDEGAKEASLLQILRFSKKELPTAGVALLFTTIRGLAWPVFAIIYGRTFLALSAIDAGEVSRTTTLNSIWFVLLGIVTGLSTFASGTLFGWVGEKMSMRLRIAVFTNILRQDGPFFDSPLHSVGKLADRLATDAQNVKAAIDQRLAEVLQGIVSLLAGITVAFSFGWNMAPIGLVTCALLIGLQGAVTQYLKFRGAEDIRVATHASQLATESIENVRTIQALTRQRQIYNSFCAASEEPHRRAVVRGIWQAVNYAMSNSFMMFNFAISYWFGLWLVQHGWTQPFIVFQVIEALNMASVSVLAAASYFPEYIRARLSAGLMFHMMNRIPKIDNLSEAGSKQPIQGDVCLRDVYFAYPTRRACPVLNHLTVSASAGRTVALVGPSGSGKSTVVQLLERFYDTTNGAVLIDGRDIRQFNVRHLRANMSLVDQQPALFNMSIRDNIIYGLDEPPSQWDIEQVAKMANIHGFVRNLPDGYDTIVGSKGAQLSGGQKQRIAIARAMIRNPKILILDEATSALDTENELVVQDALDEAQRGRTCLVIAHRLSTIQNAHLIVVLKEGRVVESGTHTQLLARKGLYFRLIQNQKLH